jgi:hypothetical protein
MRHLAKRARRRARVAKLHNERGGGLDSSLGDACAQEPSGGAAWKLVAGAWPRHCGECSNGMRQRHNGAQQHDETARSAIGGRQRGDATGRHEAALAGCSRRGLAGIASSGESVGAEEGGGFGRVSGAVAGRA